MEKLSVVILTKNEEENIARAIKSVKGIANEIIVLDSGSEDKTIEIARNLGAKVFFREFDNFSNQREYSLKLTNNNWIFVLDADEEVSEELRESIRKELKNPRKDCYFVNRRTFFLGNFLNYTLYPEWRLRLFRKDKIKYEGDIHEIVKCYGKVGRLRGDLYHYSFKNLEDFIKKNIKYSQISAEILFKKGKKPGNCDLILRPLWKFVKLYIIKRGFLDGWRGFVVSFSYAYFTFLKYTFLKEKSEVR